MSPPCPFRIESASGIPIPNPFSLVEFSNLLKRAAYSVLSIPTPLSLTEIQLYMGFSPLSISITLPSAEYSIAFLTMFVSASVVQRLSQCMMQSCFSSMVRLWISKRIATDGFTASKSSDVWMSFLIKSIAWASSFAILRSAPTSHSILFNEICML